MKDLEERITDYEKVFKTLDNLLYQHKQHVKQETLANLLDRINNEIDEGISIKEVVDIILDEIAKTDMLRSRQDETRGRVICR